jgi:hypothetical protein
MITVRIDTPEIVEQLRDRARVVLDRAVDTLGELAMDQIQVLLEDKLSNYDTRAAFLKACESRREGSYVIIQLSDPRMLGLDDGFPGFDIKAGLLSGPKVKQGESGPYQDVPFEHKVTKRGSGTFIEAKSMRTLVSKAMQEVKTGGATKRLFKGSPQRARTRLTDMKVSAAATPQGVRAQTFRRVSVNSEESSWQHPGYGGLHVFRDVAEYIEKKAPEVIMGIAEGLKRRR